MCIVQICQIYKKNNEIELINNEINFLQDLLKKYEKSQSQFQNGLMQIRRIKGLIFLKPKKYKI